MIKTKVSVVIRRSVGEVFAFVTNVENFPRWFGGIASESRQTSPGPMGVGATFVQTNQFLGRRFQTQFEVWDYEADRRFCVRTSSGPIPFSGCYLFEAVDEGTHFTHMGEMDTGGLFQLVGSLLVRRIKHDTEANLATLKELLENDHHARHGPDQPASR
jgi:uncharacterized protein YndB with AHSA1/START domain